MAVCELHVCKCKLCGNHGVKARKCIWRQRHLTHHKHPNSAAKRRAYLLSWRKVKKNTKLKSVPTYFELARQKGLDTDVVVHRSRRDLLTRYSEETNIMHKHCILNLAKTLGRCQLRKDGVVPTLGHGCTGFFVPSKATYIGVPQLLCLTGFDPAIHKNVFAAIEQQSSHDVDIMIGNAMCLPLVGTIIAAALSMVTVL